MTPRRRPLNIVPQQPAGKYPTSGQSAVYNHGPLLTEPRITPLYFSFDHQGDDWLKTNGDLLSLAINPLNELYAHLTMAGGWFELLSRTFSVPAYPIGGATYVQGPTPYCPVPFRSLFTQSHPGAWAQEEIARMIIGAIEYEGISQPDSHSLYCVWLPPGQLAWVDQNYTQKTCVDNACGFHAFDTQKWPFAYTVATVPDLTNCSVCFNFVDRGTMDYGRWFAANLAVIATHEVAEAVTDPYGTGEGWVIGDDEVCDVCVNAGPARDVAYWYSKFWDNTSGSCIP